MWEDPETLKTQTQTCLNLDALPTRTTRAPKVELLFLLTGFICFECPRMRHNSTSATVKIGGRWGLWVRWGQRCVNKSVCLFSRLCALLRPWTNLSPYRLQTLIQSVHTHTSRELLPWEPTSPCRSPLRRIMGTNPSQPLPHCHFLFRFCLATSSGTGPLLFLLLLPILHVQEQTVMFSRLLRVSDNPVITPLFCPLLTSETLNIISAQMLRWVLSSRRNLMEEELFVISRKQRRRNIRLKIEVYCPL